MTYDACEQRYDLQFWQWEMDERYAHQSEGLILATGYAHHAPDYVKGIRSRIRWTAQGQYDTHRYYTIDHDNHSIFVQNAEHNTHGFVTPDLGMCCYRNAHIVRQLLGYAYYPIERRIAFQEFGVPMARERNDQVASDWDMSCDFKKWG